MYIIIEAHRIPLCLCSNTSGTTYKPEFTYPHSLSLFSHSCSVLCHCLNALHLVAVNTHTQGLQLLARRVRPLYSEVSINVHSLNCMKIFNLPRVSLRTLIQQHV